MIEYIVCAFLSSKCLTFIPIESVTKIDKAQIDATKHKTRIRTSLEKTYTV